MPGSLQQFIHTRIPLQVMSNSPAPPCVQE